MKPIKLAATIISAKME